MKLFIHVAFLLAFICASCSKEGKMDKTFTEIDVMCDSDPQHAMSMLDNIDYGSLSTPDRHRYDLLSIKSSDKAYVRHTSDSLILDVIDYYQEHQKSGLYPEALYYAARVYSDIGDLPTALSYFYKTIDATPDDRMHTRFKSIVLNQTGRILHSIQLDSAAIDYLQRSLIIEEEADNAYGKAFTHKLLSKAYLNLHDMERASQHIQLAIHNYSNLPRNDRSSILIDSAVILAEKGQNDSALAVIRAIPLPIDSLDLPLFLAVAAETYREAGIIDTAYRYARQLISLPTPENKIMGYKVILSERVRDRFSKDSLVSLVSEYKESIESYMNRHEGNNAIIQNTKYNYSIHERNRLRAEKTLYLYVMITSIAFILVLIVLAIVLYKKFKRAETTATVSTTINILKETPEIPDQSDMNLRTGKKDEIDSAENLNSSSCSTVTDNDVSSSDGMTKSEDAENSIIGHPTNIKGSAPTDEEKMMIKSTESDDSCLKGNGYKSEDQQAIADSHDFLHIDPKDKLANIKKEILSGINSNDKDLNSLVNPGITDAQIYHRLVEKVESERRITSIEEKQIFNEVAELIESVSHGFFYRLRIITNGKITVTESQIAMLMKCGFSPKKVSILLGKEMNTVSTHRRNLAHKITGKRKADCNLDLIIISI